jgi:hypothetical protein
MEPKTLKLYSQERTSEKVGLAIALNLNLDWYTNYPDWRFLQFFLTLLRQIFGLYFD